jgi:hypothetical protein
VKNKISDLRNHLFETIERLKDEDKPMDLDRARAVSEVAQTIINTAKVEVAYLEATGQIDAGEFFDPGEYRLSREKQRLQLPGRA